MLLGVVLFVLLVAATYGLTQVFSGRGAYIHVGAIIGTIMVGNVFRVIMPAQRNLVKAIEEKRELILHCQRKVYCVLVTTTT